MRLLILTQKVDKNDDVLGFFHAWITEFAKHCESITVICLGKGEYDLPENVKVLSLGKEQESGKYRSFRSLFLIPYSLFKKIHYTACFYSFVVRERRNYDTVFVHMNQEYVLLGGVLWRAWGKKVALWRNHKKGNVLTNIAVWLSDAVFCTSKFSYTAQFKKAKIMPVGVDTESFKKDSSEKREKNSILCLGRISPVKNVDVLIDAAVLLDENGADFVLDLVGDSLPKDSEYMATVQKKSEPLLAKGKIRFLGSLPNNKTPEVYGRHEIYVNLTESGSFDKTILEAMASECIIIVSNETLKGIVPGSLIFQERNAADLAEKLKAVFSISSEKREGYEKHFREFTAKHSLTRLTEQLFDILG